MPNKKNTQRIKEMKLLRKVGATYRDIAEQFNISRQRTYQILNPHKKNKSLKKHIEEKEPFIAKKELIKIFKEKIRKNQQRRPIKQYQYNLTQTTNIKNGSRDRFRETIRLRDNHICQWCGKRWENGNRRFDVCNILGDTDHAKSNNKNANIQITLCHQCNIFLHFNGKG